MSPEIQPLGGGNFFAYRDYLSWDMKAGVLHTRDKVRVMGFPVCMLVGILEGLEEECGQAWSVVLYSCGKWWGKRQMQRFQKALHKHFGQSLEELPTAQVHAALAEAFATEGWGRVSLDIKYADKGVLRVGVKGSPFVEAFQSSKLETKNTAVDYLFAGALAGMFSYMTNADIAVTEVACTNQGAEKCEFVVGLSDKLNPVAGWLKQGMPADEIFETLAA
jgi:uncharacterized protein